MQSEIGARREGRYDAMRSSPKDTRPNAETRKRRGLLALLAAAAIAAVPGCSAKPSSSSEPGRVGTITAAATESSGPFTAVDPTGAQATIVVPSTMRPDNLDAATIAQKTRYALY